MRLVFQITILAVLLIGCFHFSHAQNSTTRRHNIAVVPFSMWTAYNGETAIGAGLSHEYFVSNNRFSLKNMLLFPLSRNLNYNHSYNKNLLKNCFNFSPGFRYYPWGTHKRLSLAFGLSGNIVAGEYISTTLNGSYTSIHDKFFQIGVLAQHTLNFNLSKRMNVGLELGVGPRLFNKYNSQLYPSSETYYQGEVYNFNFQLGYRL